MQDKYSLWPSFCDFIREHSLRIEEDNVRPLCQGWLWHCKFLIFSALSQKEEALSALETLVALEDKPRELEFLYHFDRCRLANQFNLWDIMEDSLGPLERISQAMDYALGRSWSEYYRASWEISRARYQQALDHYQRAWDSARESGDGYLEAEILNDMGFCYYRLGDQERREQYYLRSLKIRQEIGDMAGQAESLNNLGLFYVKIDLTKAEEFLKRSLSLAAQIGDIMAAGYALLNLGYLAYEKKERDQARNYYLKALDLRKRIDDNLGLGYCYLQLANIADDLWEAERLCQEAYFHFKIAEDSDGQMESIMRQAEIAINRDDTQRAVEILSSISDDIPKIYPGTAYRRYADLCRRIGYHPVGGSGIV